MPFTFNGIGTSLCGHSAPTSWAKGGLLAPNADHDAVECFVVLFLPIIPLKAVHTFNWSGNRYRVVPIRFRPGLLAQAYLRPWGIAVMLGGIAALFGAVSTPDMLEKLVFGFFGLLLVMLGVAPFLLLGRIEQRVRDIRLVLGPHELGSSDPATWQPDLLAKLPAHDAGKALAALEAGRVAEAMYQARLAAGRGDPQGETITDQILAHPRIAPVLPELRKQPWRRAEILTLAVG